LLGCFLFSGDDVFKKIRILSGGEKARVALAKVIAGRANFLLLDEPTNHLDMQSVELLIEALCQYAGSYILVSHDRYFVSRSANKYWEIEDGKILEFSGTYEEWHEWSEKRQAVRKADSGKIQKQPLPQPAATSAKKDTDQKSKQKTYQKQQRIFEQAEKALEAVETEKTILEQRL